MAKVINLTIKDLPCVCMPLSDASFSDIAAIYIVICIDANNKYTVIDIGQSGQVGSRINSHDREECWKKKCPQGNIWVCVYPLPTKQQSKEDRLALEQRLRLEYKNLCGDR